MKILLKNYLLCNGVLHSSQPKSFQAYILIISSSTVSILLTSHRLRQSKWIHFIDPEHLHGLISGSAEVCSQLRHILHIFCSLLSLGDAASIFTCMKCGSNPLTLRIFSCILAFSFSSSPISEARSALYTSSWLETLGGGSLHALLFSIIWIFLTKHWKLPNFMISFSCNKALLCVWLLERRTLHSSLAATLGLISKASSVIVTSRENSAFLSSNASVFYAKFMIYGEIEGIFTNRNKQNTKTLGKT